MSRWKISLSNMLDTNDPIQSFYIRLYYQTGINYVNNLPTIIDYIPFVKNIIVKRFTKTIRLFFLNGYYYQFADMMKSNLGYGSVKWVAPFHYFVYVNENGTAYDANGVFNVKSYMILVDEDDMPTNLLDYYKSNGFKESPIHKEGLLKFLKDYCNSKGYQYDPYIFDREYDDCSLEPLKFVEVHV